MGFTRRLFLLSGAALGCFAEAVKSNAGESTVLRGKLRQRDGQPPVLETADHKMVALEGEDAAIKTLKDARINGFDLEVRGHFTAPDHFLIDPNHARTALIRKDGKLKMITYWCDTCSIRSYEPGPCWCCQQETVLQLRDPDQP